ncbi:MAG: hypothetical protein HUJ60_01335 [Bacilli bacterium]|nr:hypothetical protein [Bacilli bacterium]
MNRYDVCFKVITLVDKEDIPAGMEGLAVMSYDNDGNYLVEFTNPDATLRALLSYKSDEIKRKS